MRITTLSFAITITAAGLAATPAAAGELAVSVEIPRLRVAEYHKPYVAIWIEDGAGKVVANLNVWYQVDNAKNEGPKWLADMRTWWRRAGRTLKVPANGVTGPTRPPGAHRVAFTEGRGPLPRLAPGQYKLNVEAAREVGGRELVSIPFEAGAGAKSASARGSTELGAVSLTYKP